PLAQYLHTHPDATRWDLLDFIRHTWGVSVSRMALHRFLKRYGLQDAGALTALPKPAAAAPAPPADAAPPPPPTGGRQADVAPAPAAVPAPAPPPAEGPLPLPPADFFL